MHETFNPVEIGTVAANGKLTLKKAAPASTLGRVLAEVCAERARNHARWGVQDYPSSDSLGGPGACNLYGIPSERAAKATVERCTKEGRLTWTDVLLEEFAEVVEATNDVDRRAELVQVAAVALAWIECIDRRSAADMAGFDALARQQAIDAERALAGQGAAKEDDYYVLVMPWAVYVKEGHFFESQGGCTAEWGKAWRKVRATSIEDARRQGYRMPRAEVLS